VAWGLAAQSARFFSEKTTRRRCAAFDKREENVDTVTAGLHQRYSFLGRRASGIAAGG